MKKYSILIILSLSLCNCELVKGNDYLSSIYSSEQVESSNFLSSSDNQNYLTNIKYDNIDKTPLENENKISLNKQTYNDIGSYKTGNYSSYLSGSEINNIDGINFEHYRATYYTNGFASLMPYHGNINDNTIPAALYNTTKIKNISRMILEYSTSIDSDNGLNIYYGTDITLNQNTILKGSKENINVELNFQNVNYFKIETISQIINLTSIDIYYTNDDINSNSNFLEANKDNYRINPIVYNGILEDGVSSVEVPIDVTIKNNSYVVNKTKKYTYYSYEYIKEHPEYVDKATMIDPIDVATYYIAFKKFPANYFSSASKALKGEDYDLFGNNIRQVSKEYSRTNGYAQTVPYNKNGLKYIEFDIDIGNTYIQNKSVSREVGRVVIFTNGFSYQGYDNSPVALFTDDHYATFQEYLNLGSYGTRFNAQAHRTNYVWGCATTLD